MSGLNELNKLLKNLERKVDEVNGEVSFTDLFNPNFMTTFTNFNSTDEFFKKSPFEVHCQEDFESLDENLLNEYVKANTRLSTWEEMKSKAGEFYVKHNIEF